MRDECREQMRTLSSDEKGHARAVPSHTVSTNRDLLSKHGSREELERALERKLLGMARRRLAADDHLALNLLDDQVSNPSMGCLADFGFDPFGQAEGGIDAIYDHVANLRRLRH